MTYIARSSSPYATPGNVFRTITSNGNTFSFCDNGTTQVAGFYNGLISYSEDGGVTWNGAIVNGWASGNFVKTIIWDGSRFLAAANYLYVSTDGKYWDRNSTTTSVYGIAYSASLGIYVRGISTSLDYSTDLISWTTGFTNPGSSSYMTIKWTGNAFIATNTAAGLMYRSTNGINWSVVNENREKYTIVSDGSNYYAYGVASTGRISTDGLKWTPITYSSNNGIRYVDSVYDTTYKFVSVSASNSVVYNSTDGITATGNTNIVMHPVPVFNAVTKKSTGVGNFAVAGTYDAKAFSTDAVTWSASTTKTYPMSTVGYTRLASRPSGSNPGLFVLGRIASTLYSGMQYSTDGVTWSLSNALSNNTWSPGDVPADRMILAVSTNGKAITTNDGINWSPEYSMPSAISWIAPVYISSVSRYIVAASNSSSIAYSTTGQTWSSTTSGVSANWVKGAAHSTRAVFIANPSASVITTTDGVTWSSGTVTSRGWSGVATNGTNFVMVASGTAICAVSTNGTTWTEYALPISSNWSDITWNSVEGLYYVVSATYGAVIISTDGITWTTIGGVTGGPSLVNSINGITCAVTTTNISYVSRPNTSAFLTTGATPTIYTVTHNPTTGKYSAYGTSRVAQESTDGITWSASKLNYMPKYSYSRLINFNGMLLANHGMRFGQTLGTGDLNIPFSKNTGADWGTTATGAIAQYSQAMATNGTSVVRLGATGNSVYPTVNTSCLYTTDGMNWSTKTMPVSLAWTGVAWGNSKYIAVGYGTSRAATTSAATSTDGSTWTSLTMPASLAWSGIEFGNGAFVATWIQPSSGNYGLINTVYRSTDGVTWSTITLPYSSYWGTLRYAGNKFFLLDNGVLPPAQDYAQQPSNAYLYSTDGVTWSTGSFGPRDRKFSDVAYNGSVYCAVIGSHHSLATKDAYISTDGITWALTILPHMSTWSAITNVGSTFVAIAQDDYLCIASTDGVTWETKCYSLPTTINKAVSSTDGYNWLVGTGGEVTKTDNVSSTRISVDRIGSTLYSIQLMDDGNLLVGGQDTSSTIYKVDVTTGRIWYTAPGVYGSSYALQFCGSYGNTAVYISLIGGYPTDYIWIRKDNWWTGIDTSIGYPVDASSGGIEQMTTYANSKFYMIRGASGSYMSKAKLISSTDGVDWVTESTFNTTSNYILGYFNNRFVSYHDSTQSSSSPLYSTDGVTWTAGSGTYASGQAWRYAQSPNVFIFLNVNNKNIITRTTDGITWSNPSVTTVGSTINGNIGQTEIYWNPSTSKFHMFGDTSTANSTDGVTWSYNLDVYPPKTSGALLLSDNTFAMFSYANSNEFLTKYTSTDGITWSSTQCNMHFTNTIMHDGQSYIALTGASTFYYSTDGVTWYASYRVYTASAFRDIVKTTAGYAAVDNIFNGGSGYVFSSTDGCTWKTDFTPTDTYGAIASDGSTAVAIGGTYHAFSTDDGVTWKSNITNKPAKLPGVGVLSHLAVNAFDNKFYSITNTADAQAYNSYYETTDNLKWTTNRLCKTANSINIHAFTKKGNTALIISSSYSYSSTGRVIHTSTDGYTWTEYKNTSRLSGLTPVACSNNGTVFTVIMAEGYAVNSTDGISWGDLVRLPMGSTFGAISQGTGANVGIYPISTSMVWTGDKYILLIGASPFVPTTTTYYLTSPDGVSWTLRNTLPGTYAWTSVATSGNTVIAVSTTSTTNIALSTDGGLTWSTRTVGVNTGTFGKAVYGGGVFVIFKGGSTDTTTYRSTDGVTWTTVSIPMGWQAAQAALIWDDNKFIMISARSTFTTENDILQSTDGLTWTKISTYIGANTNCGTMLIKFGNVYTTIDGQDIAYSTDLQNWYRNTNSNINLQLIDKQNGAYYVGGSYSTIFKNGIPENYNYYAAFTEVTYG